MAEQAEDDAPGPGSDRKYSLGMTAAAAMATMDTGREAVCERAREYCELTIPEVMPPKGYEPGDDLPGNNQSMGAQAHSTLAAKIAYTGFPPGQPMCRFEPVEYEAQQQLEQDPEFWQATQLGLSRLEQIHRKRANTVGLSGFWEQFAMLLLGAGNGLWKYTELSFPTFHRPDSYVVRRARNGLPLVMILEEETAIVTLDHDLQDFIMEKDPDLREKEEWDRVVTIHSVCRLRREDGPGEDDWYWEFWQEYEGHMLPDTEVDTDYDNPPMYAEWLIPAYGKNWGHGYLHRYRGDLYTLEAAGSGLNDGTAIASWSLMFVKPGGQTNIRQVTKAANLSTLPGVATDITFPVTGKTGDMNFVGANFDRAARRIASAFLMQQAIQREGERVTAEEVSRLGSELDKAMGGLYTLVAQGPQRRLVTRFIRLHEEANKKLPKLPKGVVEVQVVTGVDAMGRSIEDAALTEVVSEANKSFGPEITAKHLNVSGWFTAKFAAKGLKPEGLVRKKEEVEGADAAAQKQGMQQELLSKAAGPVAGALAGRLAEGGMPGMAGGQGPQPPAQPEPQGVAANG